MAYYASTNRYKQPLRGLASAGLRRNGACGLKVRKLTQEACQANWEEFLDDLEHNPDPADTWRNIKALSGFPASIPFSEPLAHNGRTVTTNLGKGKAFMKVYAALNRLNFSRNERSCIRQLQEALRSRTMNEAYC